MYKTDLTGAFACLITYPCRHITMDTSTTITFLSNTHCLAQSSAQPFHPRHEDDWSVFLPISRWCCCYVLVQWPPCWNHHFLTEKMELGERDLKTMLQNHREKRKRQPVSGVWRGKKQIWFSLNLYSISLMIDLLRTIQTWWLLISTLETFSQEQILVGRGLCVSK